MKTKLIFFFSKIRDIKKTIDLKIWYLIRCVLKQSLNIAEITCHLYYFIIILLYRVYVFYFSVKLINFRTTKI